MDPFLPLADAFEDVRGKVVVLNILDAAIDDLSEIEGLGPPCLRCQEGKPLLGLRSQSNRGCHVGTLQQCDMCIQLSKALPTATNGAM